MATAAAVVVARAQQELTSHFLSRGAVSAEQAVPYEPRRRIDRRMFERFRDKGVIQEAKPGRYWLDVRTWDEMRQTMRRRVGIGVATGLVIASALAAIFA